MGTLRKDGRLQSSVTIINPITGAKSKQFIYGYSEEELEAERRRIKSQSIDDFLRVETFSDWCEEFLKIKQDDKLEPSTIEGYRRTIAVHFTPFLPPNLKVAEITPVHIRYLLRKIKGDRTRENAYVLLNSILHQAQFNQLITNNPCFYVNKPKYVPKTADVIEPDVYNKIIQYIAGTMYEYLYKFAWDTGLRRGEICALRVSDISLKESTVSVTKARKKGLSGEYEGGPKSKYSVRTITLSPHAIINIKDWLKILRRELFKAGLPWNTSDYLFRAQEDISKPLPLSTLTHSFMIVKKKLKLSSATRFHSLRHTHATNLAEQELSPKKIQLRLGHSSSSFTMDRYVHPTKRMNDGVKEKIVEIEKIYNQ